jgi:hypothetical protein
LFTWITYDTELNQIDENQTNQERPRAGTYATFLVGSDRSNLNEIIVSLDYDIS